MSADAFVTFGADTGELEAAMAKASAEVRGLARELSSLANEQRRAGDSADADLISRFNATAAALAGAKGHVRDLKEEMRGVGAAASEAGEGAGHFAQIREVLQGLTSPLRAVRDNLGELAEAFVAAFAAEKIKEFVEHMAELGLETKKAVEILGVSTEDVGALSLIAKASGASLEQLEMQFSRFARNLVEETKPAKRALDTLGLSFDELRGKPAMDQLGILADAFARLPAGAERTAAAMEIFGRAGLQMLPLLAQGREAIEDWGRAAERTGTKLSDGMVAAMEATHRASTELGAAIEGVGVTIFGDFHDAINGSIALLIDLAESFRRAIAEGGSLRDTLHGLSEALQIIESVFAGFIADFKLLLVILDAAAVSFDHLQDKIHNLFGGGILGALGVPLPDWLAPEKTEHAAGSFKDIWKKAFDDIKAIVEGGQKEIDAIWGRSKEPAAGIGKASEAAVALKSRFDEVLDSIKGTGGGIDELTRKIETLKDALGGIPAAGGAAGAGPGLSSIGPTGSATELIKHFEGFRSQAYFDVNAYRTGYGSDTTTDASGRVSAVTADTVTTREDAERDLARRTAEFAAKAAEQVGEAWGKLSDNARASLTSIAYNYGRLPSDVAAAAQSGDSSRIAGAIRAHERDNGGVNSGRRAQEAANIERPDLSPDDRKRGEQGLADLERKKRDLEHGTPRQQAEGAALEAEAKGAGDLLKAKQALVDADKQEVEEAKKAGDFKGQREAEKKLTEDQLALQKAVTASKEADLSLEKGRAKGDPSSEHRVATQLAETRMAQAKALYGQDSAEYKRAQAEKEAADRQFVDQTNRLNKMQVDEELKSVRSAAQEKRKALDDELSHKQISASRWLSQSKAIDEQERASAQALYAQEASLAGQTAEQKLAIKQREADAMRELDQKEADEARKAADQTRSAYEGEIGGILSSFTSAFKGMISGHETFKQAMLKALENLAGKFIDMVEKMVVKWLAGQLAQTAATTAGVTARTAAETAGGAVNAAANAGAALKSISTSAGEAFAGVFGFSAPLLGPAAAAPAAAAEATVLSVGAGLVSADIGMWQVPSDMTAMIHRNELVMPAAQASAFRDMLSGSSAGSGGRAVNVNPAMHLHVSALDSQSFRGFARDNQRGFMQAMHSAVRSGAALGLRAR